MKQRLALLFLVVLIGGISTEDQQTIRKCCPTHQALNQWHSCQNASNPLGHLKLFKQKVCKRSKCYTQNVSKHVSFDKMSHSKCLIEQNVSLKMSHSKCLIQNVKKCLTQNISKNVSFNKMSHSKCLIQ